VSAKKISKFVAYRLSSAFIPATDRRLYLWFDRRDDRIVIKDTVIALFLARICRLARVASVGLLNSYGNTRCLRNARDDVRNFIIYRSSSCFPSVYALNQIEKIAYRALRRGTTYFLRLEVRSNCLPDKITVFTTT